MATFLLVWSTAVVVLARSDSCTRRSPSADGAGAPISSRVAATALVVLTVAAGLLVANAYTAHLVSVSAHTRSADQLRRIAHGCWVHLDSRVLVAVASNESIPTDLVSELRDAADDVQTSLAYNPSTPLSVLLDMSATNWSAAHVVADARSRHADTVTPDMLRTISAGPFSCSLTDVLTKNPTTPADVRDDLGRRSSCRDRPETGVRQKHSGDCPPLPRPL